MSVVAPPRPAQQARRTEGRQANRERTEERHLRVVASPINRTSRRLISFLVLIALFLILFATVTFHVKLVTGQQRIDRLNKRAEAAQTTYDRLRVQVDSLSAPQRVIARAKSLGMVEADNPTWLAPTSPSIGGANQSDGSTLRDYLDVKPYLQDTP